MKFMEKAKRFFTLNAANHEGFTLVELIVVIAILAILAGVAVPAYSGYIEKSKEAADETLLAAVNKAFAAAVTAGGSDLYLVNDAELTVNNRMVKGLATVAVTGSVDVAAAQEAFELFYAADNGDAQFQVYTQLDFNAADHVFVGLKEGEVVGILKDLLSVSNFNNNLPKLTGDVGSLVTSLKGYLDSDAANSITGGGFDTYMKETLGLENPSAQEMANAAVLYMGHTAANMTAEDIANAKTNVATQIAMLAGTLADDNPNNDSLDLSACGSLVEGSQLASYAALYAAAEAVALSEQAKGNDGPMNALKPENLGSPQDVITAVSNAFKAAGPAALGAYVTPTDAEGTDPNTTAAFKDLDAYFETIKAVNGKEDDLKGKLSTEDLYTTDKTIQDLLAQLQG